MRKLDSKELVYQLCMREELYGVPVRVTQDEYEQYRKVVGDVEGGRVWIGENGIALFHGNELAVKGMNWDGSTESTS